MNLRRLQVRVDGGVYDDNILLAPQDVQKGAKVAERHGRKLYPAMMPAPATPPAQMGRPLPRHFPALDGVRAVAVLAVIASHYVPRREFVGVDLLGYAAVAGVRLFFALSGLLITGLLLDAAARRTPLRRELWAFYGKRALRIFPLYYAVLAVCWLLDVGPARSAVWPLATFTYNEHLVRQGWWDLHLAHFWSLSVEQQFYLGWPLAVLLLSPRRVLVLCAGMIATAHVWRWYFTFHGTTGMETYAATLASVDSLALGAALAVLARTHGGPPWLRAALGPRAAALAGAGMLALALVQPALVRQTGYVGEALFDVVQSIAFAALLWTALGDPADSTAARWLSVPWLRAVGTVSYGLYVFHPVMLAATRAALAVVGWHSRVLPPAVALVATALLATASWRWFEAPINRLKRFL